MSRFRESAAWPWMLSMLVGAVLVLVIEIDKRHYAAHTTGGRIGGGILIWVLFTLVIRLLVFLANRFRSS
jgi:hypothetical protein